MLFKLIKGISLFVLVVLINGCNGSNSTPILSEPTLNISLTVVVAGLDAPLYITALPDGSGRLLVLEKSGTIQLLGKDYTVIGEFLNIASRVISSGEQGLLGLAFDPNVSTNGFFYLYYSSAVSDGRCVASLQRCSRIARFSLHKNGTEFDFSGADAGSEQLVLEVDQPASNHNGGMLAFGPDGYLYIALGDGGGGNDQFLNGQNLNSLLGALLRIDVSDLPYGIPADNPFVAAGEDVKKEIFALGLRNPWRFSFDRLEGTLWLADVGQGEWEEIDVIRAGGNYGWSIREGGHSFNTQVTQATTPLIEPVFEYGHDAGYSITGGYVYRGSQLPQLQGFYIYGDYSGPVWALNPQTLENHLIATAPSVASFGEDENGELFVVDLSGTIFKLTAETASNVEVMAY